MPTQTRPWPSTRTAFTKSLGRLVARRRLVGEVEEALRSGSKRSRPESVATHNRPSRSSAIAVTRSWRRPLCAREAPKPICGPVVDREARAGPGRARPQAPAAILEERRHGGEWSAAGVGILLSVDPEAVAVVPVEPFLGAKPHEATAVLHDRLDPAVRQAVQHREALEAQRSIGCGRRGETRKEPGRQRRCRPRLPASWGDGVRRSARRTVHGDPRSPVLHRCGGGRHSQNGLAAHRPSGG